MEEDNILTECLGKALKTEIKFVTLVYPTFFTSLNKQIRLESIPNTHMMLCLGKECIFFVDNDKKIIIEQFCYSSLYYMEISQKNKKLFNIYLNVPLQKCGASRITVINEFRGQLIKNIMCYYSVYFMFTNAEVKELKLFQLNDITSKYPQKKKKELDTDPLKKYKLIAHRFYEYFIKLNVKDNYNNTDFLIDYGKNEDETLATQSYLSVTVNFIFN